MKTIESACEKIFRLAGKVQCEVTAETKDSALTRFADNVISQNVAVASTDFSVRLSDGGRTARVNFNQAGAASLESSVKLGLDLLRRQKKDPGLPPLPKPRPLAAGSRTYFAETAGLDPAFRARKARDLALACKKAGQTACGTFETGCNEVVIANSLGVFARHKTSLAEYSVTVKDGDGSGWAEYSAFDASAIPFGELNARARAKAAGSRAPRDIKPGKYTVILEPQAAADLLAYLAIYGFGGQFYNEGQSFASGNLGKKLLSPLLSMEDNALDGAAPGLPFDYEGQPRQKVTLADRGVLRAVVHDRRTAKAAGAASTGHALPQPSAMGPIPLNLSVKPGTGTLEDLIKGAGRAILVTQFHYTNLLKPRSVEMTGMTRNGTFLVEDGKISYPVKNLRFTQSMVDAFSRVEAIAGAAVPCVTWGRMACPAMRLGDFNFSSATKF
ncbi:MAG TPA: TldD/PmbA family protein [Elusimicrobiales bacterium]|mgnify:CR=1 FL=1|nr:TldD/PmbA family protein [Elusimicrobiales bacterium]